MPIMILPWQAHVTLLSDTASDNGSRLLTLHWIIPSQEQILEEGYSRPCRQKSWLLQAPVLVCHRYVYCIYFRTQRERYAFWVLLVLSFYFRYWKGNGRGKLCLNLHSLSFKSRRAPTLTGHGLYLPVAINHWREYPSTTGQFLLPNSYFLRSRWASYHEISNLGTPGAQC